MSHRLYVGCIGEGIFRSTDGGGSFRRACDGMPFVECDVRALVVHPNDPRTLYAGSETGLFVTRDGADSWERLPAPLDGLQVWSILLAPGRPDLVLAGTRPAGIFRSEDGGRSWAPAATRMTRDCPRILHTRVTCLLGDPGRPERFWAGVEIDGLHVSEDAGRTWAPIGEGLSSRDIHDLALVPGTPRRMLATTNNDLNVSTDDGATWAPQRIGGVLPWPYCRGLRQQVGAPAVVFLGNGDFPPGSEGRVAVSRDGGQTWKEAPLPAAANSTVWNFAVHPADVDLVYAATVSGQVFRSADGGRSWEKLKREFGEVRALAWTP